MIDTEGQEASDESLESILADEAPAPEPEKSEPEPQAEAATDSKQDAAPAEGAEKVDEATPASEPESEEQSWTKVAALDERRKRQASDLRADKAEARVKQLETPEVPRPDIFEDQKGALDHLEQRFELLLTNRIVKVSRSNLKETKTDYDDMEKVFVKLAEDDPRLVADMRASDSPAKFAYDTAVKHLKIEALATQDPDALRAKIKEEVRLELKSEAKEAEDDESALDRKAGSVSLATSRAAGNSDVPDELSLEDVLG